MNSNLIYSSVVYRKEMALKLAIYTAIMLILLYFANNILNNKFLSFLFLIVSVLPVFFLKMIMRLFVRKISIDMHENYFLLAIENKNGNEGWSNL